MPQTSKKFAEVDPVWSRIRDEALELVKREPLLRELRACHRAQP